MDKATFFGLIFGIGIIGSAILMGSSPQVFLNLPALMVVAGGTLAATLIKFPIKHVLNAIRVAGNAFTAHSETPIELIERTKELAAVARKRGMLALEDESVNNPFYKKGLQLCVDGMPPDLVQKILREDMDITAERHSIGQRIFRSLGDSAPAFGMIGTLVGLVQMLVNLDDPAAIGPAMAVALLTTLYGALFAQLIALPIADKLELRQISEQTNQSLIIEGIHCIQQGYNPRIIEELLTAYLPSKVRERQILEREAADRGEGVATEEAGGK